MKLLKLLIKKGVNYFSKEQRELRRLSSLPRYKSCRTSLLGTVEIADAVSFVAGYNEIFINENYYFEAATVSPYIIDCGSNIGLSIIYFKKLYPEAQIIAFEPDPELFQILKRNLSSLFLDKIDMQNKAVSGSSGKLLFQREGGFSGRLSHEGNRNSISVESVTLSPYINQRIDFLKIDIEGAEVEVLHEIKDKLHWVDYLFVEYHSFYGKEQRLDEILLLLKESGYRTHIKEAHSSPHPFKKILLVSEMDNQLEIYAWRNK